MLYTPTTTTNKNKILRIFFNTSLFYLIKIKKWTNLKTKKPTASDDFTRVDLGGIVPPAACPKRFAYVMRAGMDYHHFEPAGVTHGGSRKHSPSLPQIMEIGERDDADKGGKPHQPETTADSNMGSGIVDVGPVMEHAVPDEKEYEPGQHHKPAPGQHQQVQPRTSDPASHGIHP